MGWSYGPKPERVKAHLGGLLTFETREASRRCVRLAFRGFTTAYAAVERIDRRTGERQVYAVVFELRFTGGMMGYKYVPEDWGPIERRCPRSVLDLLTPSTSEWAIKWRADCRIHTRR